MTLLTLISHFGGAACSNGNFFGFPSWYMYLPGTTDVNGNCVPQVTNINDVWLIVAAGLEILTRLAALVAVGYVVYSGFMYLTSQGEPDKTAHARMGLIAALVGLGISVTAAVVIGYIAGSIK